MPRAFRVPRSWKSHPTSVSSTILPPASPFLRPVLVGDNSTWGRHCMGSPFICDLTAMDTEQRERHRIVAQHLHGAIQEVRELPDGYALRFPVEPSTVFMAAEFIT